MPYYNGLYNMRLKLTDMKTYWKGLDCQVVVSAEPGEKLMIYFEYMEIEDTIGCINDWLDVYDGDSKYSPYVDGLTHQLCGFTAPSEVYHTSGNYITLHMESNEYLEYKGFSVIITRYHDGFCKNTEFQCQNQRCINNSLVCGGYNPCGDHSDCQTPEPDHGVVLVLHLGGILGVAGGAVLLILIVVLVCVIVTRRRRRRVYRETERIVTGENRTDYGTPGNRDSLTMPPPYSKQVPPPGV